MKTFFVMTLSLLATSVVYAAPICNTLENCLSLQTQVAARIRELSPTPVTRTTISGHKFTQVTNRPALGNAWKDESGVIWGDLVVGSDGNPKTMMRQEARDYCNSLSDDQHQYLLPTNAQFEQLSKYLGDGSASGYNPEILPNLIRNRVWSGSHRVGHTGYVFYGSYGTLGSFDRYGSSFVRCAGQ